MKYSNSAEDLDRLIVNQRSLFETIPEMVMLVNGDISIEYMNPSAEKFFKRLTEPPLNGSSDLPEVYSKLLKEVKGKISNPDKKERILSTQIDGSYIEYSIASCTGYRGDILHWLIMRNVTERKKQEEELEQFNSNIEHILSDKIKKLNESEETRQHLLQELNTLKSNLDNHQAEGTMVGSSGSLKGIREMVHQVAKSDATVLITGESGTGKELVANLIRETSNRNKKPFLKINCNTINDSLLESDLFGYEKGSFTGAHSRKKGKFEVVDNGTIFLDEIGDISPRMQAALLRVLQDGEIIRVGGNSPINVDVRVIAATNRDLATAVKEGTFRLDLYYRLNIINIAIPSLRDRKEDIIDLVSHFIRRYRSAFKKHVDFVPKSIIDRLKNHTWPGNVRELENVIQRAVLMAKTNIITDQELMFDIQPGMDEAESYVSFLQKLDGMPLKSMVAEMERDIIIHNLSKSNGNVSKTSKSLTIGKTALYDKMKRYGISAKDYS